MRRAFWHWGLIISVGLGSVLPARAVVDVVFSTTLCGDPYKPLRRYVQKYVRAKVQVKDKAHRGTVFASGLVDMFAMLSEAGVPHAEVHRIFNLISPNSREPLQRDPVFSSLIEGLRQIELSRKFVVCVLDQKCWFNSAELGAVFLQPESRDIQVARVLESSGMSDAEFKSDLNGKKDHFISDGDLRAFRGSGVPSMILLQETTLSFSEEVPFVSFRGIASHIPLADHFFHEAMHYVDWQLILQWVAANQRLIRARKKPSDWYQQFVREVDGVAYVSAEFFSFFSEIRAYYVTGLLLQRRLKEAGFRISSGVKAQVQHFITYRALTTIARNGGNNLINSPGFNDPEIFNYTLSIRETLFQDITR